MPSGIAPYGVLERFDADPETAALFETNDMPAP